MANSPQAPEIVEAEREQASALLLHEAAKARLVVTSNALVQLEARVDSMGASPRYVVSWEQHLRDARESDEAAANAVSESQSNLDRIFERLSRLNGQR